MSEIIALLGYMGSGKSTLGKALATSLELPFRDLDEQIEAHAGSSIKELFAAGGEIAFRKLETQVLTDEVQREEGHVLALGGGTPCYGQNLDILHKAGVKTVYLKLSLATLLERLKRGQAKRPLIADLTEEQLEEFIRKHLFERQFYYNQASCVVDVDGLSVEQAVERIARTCLYSK